MSEVIYKRDSSKIHSVNGIQYDAMGRPLIFNCNNEALSIKQVQDVIAYIGDVLRKLLMSDADECLAMTDLGKDHAALYWMNPNNFINQDRQEFASIVLPEYMRRLLHHLPPNKAQEFVELAIQTVDAYFRVVHDRTEINAFHFHQIATKLDDKTYEIERILTEKNVNFAYPTSERPLLIRVRLYHGQTREKLADSYKDVVVQKSMIYQILDGLNPIIATTNLQELIEGILSHFPDRREDQSPKIYGSTYMQTDNGFFNGQLHDTCFKVGKVMNVFAGEGLDFQDASDILGLMCGDSISNDLPAMLYALMGSHGIALVRLKGNKTRKQQIEAWVEAFKDNGINERTIKERVIFTDDRNVNLGIVNQSA